MPVRTLAQAAYSSLVWGLQPLLRLKLRRRALSEPGYGQAVEERFGSYLQPSPPAHELIWIHAVSLGETRAAAVLMHVLRQQRPDLRFLLTHGTATGRAMGATLLHEGDVQVWQPWDTPAATRAFLAHFKPRLGVLMETEIWPNLIRSASVWGVPLVLANARLSEKSLQRALQWASLARPAYGALSAVWAQSEEDAQRLRQVGAPVQAVVGNLKFDARPDPAQRALAAQRRVQLHRPLLVLASSREGEEALLLEALAQCPQPWPFDLLIVPRHPQRFDEVAALIERRGHRISRRSAWGPDLSNWPLEPGSIALGDSIGEMALYYGLSSVCLLGGSFLALGGQNLIESAACGCPVIMGPHTFNFREAADQALLEGAACRVADFAGAIQTACEWMQDGSASRRSDLALSFAQRHRGAAEATAERLLRIV
jgi:3-deoxy-D-manno-octulosonic-acid transferase